MSKNVLFIHGAGDGGYEADTMLVARYEMSWEQITPSIFLKCRKMKRCHSLDRNGHSRLVVKRFLLSKVKLYWWATLLALQCC